MSFHRPEHLEVIRLKSKVMEQVVKLKNCPYPARKMRLLADLVRGHSVMDALNMIKYHPKRKYSEKLENLIISAVSGWKINNEDSNTNEDDLFIKGIFVDNARQLKRIRPAPQGRAHRIRKRSNHVTVIIDSIIEESVEAEVSNKK